MDAFVLMGEVSRVGGGGGGGWGGGGGGGGRAGGGGRGGCVRAGEGSPGSDC